MLLMGCAPAPEYLKQKQIQEEKHWGKIEYVVGQVVEIRHGFTSEVRLADGRILTTRPYYVGGLEMGKRYRFVVWGKSPDVIRGMSYLGE